MRVGGEGGEGVRVCEQGAALEEVGMTAVLFPGVLGHSDGACLPL